MRIRFIEITSALIVGLSFTTLAHAGGDSATTNVSAQVRGVRVPATGGEWPRFRGPQGSGKSAARGLPMEWSDNKNIVWKVKLPGPGTSSPIVWADRIYLTSYSGYGEDENAPGDQDDLKRHLVCVKRQTGRVMWTTVMMNRARVFQFQGFRALHGYASSTPTVDETGVYVFNGTSGAAAYTHDGKLRWNRSLGTRIHGWGTSASPVLYKNLVIYHADIEGRGLVALDKKTGDEIWRVSSGRGDSWSTPALAVIDGHAELVFHHSQGEPAKLMSVDPANGKLLWECGVLKNYLAPSPVVAGNVCYAIAYGRAAAIRLGGEGDVTDSHLEWTAGRGSEICTPVFDNGHLYWAHQESGVAYCLDAKTGRTVYEERMQPRPGRIYSSGVLADGKIFYVSRENGTYVVSASPQYRLLAHNTIASDKTIFNASPAISGKRLLIRSGSHLYCIGEE